MTTAEIFKLKEITNGFAQAILDTKLKVNPKKVFSQRTFDGMFKELFILSYDARVVTDIRTKIFFEFMGKKIDAINKKEYLSIRIYLKEHFVNNGHIF
jgi:hypothetical protein